MFVAVKRVLISSGLVCLTAGCASSSVYESVGAFGGKTLVLHDAGTFELRLLSDVVDENCVYSGVWSRSGSDGEHLHLQFERVRALNKDQLGCQEITSGFVSWNGKWQVRADALESPGGARLSRVRRR